MLQKNLISFISIDDYTHLNEAENMVTQWLLEALRGVLTGGVMTTFQCHCHVLAKPSILLATALQ